MSIDWMSLVQVALVSFAFGVGIVAVYSFGVLGVSMAEPGNGPTGLSDAIGSDRAAPSSRRTAGLALAGVCFLACAAAVLFGLWLIIPQFH